MVRPSLYNTAKKSISNAFCLGQLDEYEQLNNQIKQYWAYLIYNNNHSVLIQNTLQYRYPNTYKDMYKFVDPTINPLRRVADNKAVCYAKPPTRRANNQQLQTLLNSSAHKINRALDHANKVLNYAGNVLIWPCIALSKGAATDFNLLVIEPHNVYLVPNYDDGKYDIVAKYLDYHLVSEYVGEYEGDRRNYVLDKKGNLVALFADLGAPVWASLTYTNFGAPRSISAVNDLIAGTIAINVMEAFSEKNTYLKSFKQPIEATTDSRTKADQLTAGPNNIWPSTVDTIDLADKNNFYEELINQRNINLCGQHGLSKIIATGDYQNDQSWTTVSQELIFHFEATIENWKLIETELWVNVCAMALIDLPENTTVFVKFNSPYPSTRVPQEDFALHREKVKAGIESTIDRILEEHPELNTREEAIQLHKENLQALGEEYRVKRELNIPDAGNSPEENGKAGVAAKMAKEYGKLGAEGPSVDGKEIESEMIRAKYADEKGDL